MTIGDTAGGEFDVVVDPPDLADARFAALKRYWDSKRGQRAMPRRSEIDPLELRPHLPNLFMFDVLDGGRDFRFRLLGTAITATYGRDSTGKSIRELYWPGDPQLGEWTITALARAAQSQRPVLARGPLRAVRKDFIAHVSLILPLSDDGIAANIVLGETHFLAPGEAHR